MSWHSLTFFEKAWKSSGILQDVCTINLLCQVVFMVRSHQIGFCHQARNHIVLFGSRHSRMDQVKFVEESLLKYLK